ncbi:MAG: 4-hydroxy-tetrahydrodipicolinate reductase, partial [Mesorhizobium sp.]|nr:4-hydroxy-tetrahydrodipicolinate reductase [Mesorhizobium sp.]
MAIRVVMAGATGWVGKALIPAIIAQKDFTLAGAVSRSAAGQDAG